MEGYKVYLSPLSRYSQTNILVGDRDICASRGIHMHIRMSMRVSITRETYNRPLSILRFIHAPRVIVGETRDYVNKRDASNIMQELSKESISLIFLYLRSGRK